MRELTVGMTAREVLAIASDDDEAEADREIVAPRGGKQKGKGHGSGGTKQKSNLLTPAAPKHNEHAGTLSSGSLSAPPAQDGPGDRYSSCRRGRR